MCGFFISTSSKRCTNYNDVTSRGWQTVEFSHKQYTAIQSQLPCYNGICDFGVYENDQYIFSFTGEVYNTPSNYNSDTEYMLECVINNNLHHINGQWAFALYDKKTQTVTIGRDTLGQIPLFIYNENCIIASNTLPSIVRTVETKLDPDTINRWYTSRHYTSQATCWHNIRSVQPGSVTTYNIKGKVIHATLLDRIWHNTQQDLQQTILDIASDYDSPLRTASIASGGLDSTIIAKLFNTNNNITIDHVGKDWVSNQVESFDHIMPVRTISITKAEWFEYLEELVNETYTIPYSWSWVGYYILGKNCDADVLYTGEGADEIFGGYPGYDNATTPYSTNPEHSDLRNALYSVYSPSRANKLLDQSVFIPVSCTGANLALGCSTVESRNPFLDTRIANNLQYADELGKPSVKDIFVQHFGDSRLHPKQGFGGWPDEYGLSIGQPDWKAGCWNLVQRIFSHQ